MSSTQKKGALDTIFDVLGEAAVGLAALAIIVAPFVIIYELLREETEDEKSRREYAEWNRQRALTSDADFKKWCQERGL